ncbi:hypothetical protein DH2020_024604 [Rehmannia glutinosa]|uniref:Rho termination factor-like N-terminal domain-containing protein n=1 Tax=Rehmannia glutinosa TaxID=99300 RepID=A0ABR0W231_REHGL
MLFLRIAGSVPPDDRYLPCSGVSGKTLGISPISSHGDHKLFSNVKFLYSRCTSRYILSVCNASSSNYRRNPDSSWQNKRKFSHNRNKHNEERDGYEDLEESDSFSSRNGPLLSVYGNQKSQATATPGPKEKEIVELFRKPIYSDGTVSSISHDDLDSGRKRAGLEPEAVDFHEGRSDSESDVDTLFSEGNELDEISEDENSEFYENEHDGVAEEQNLVEASDLSGMKLTELRAVAKSRGMKGYSKLKKNELIELLSGPV